MPENLTFQNLERTLKKALEGDFEATSDLTNLCTQNIDTLTASELAKIVRKTYRTTSAFTQPLIPALLLKLFNKNAGLDAFKDPDSLKAYLLELFQCKPLAFLKSVYYKAAEALLVKLLDPEEAKEYKTWSAFACLYLDNILLERTQVDLFHLARFHATQNDASPEAKTLYGYLLYRGWGTDINLNDALVSFKEAGELAYYGARVLHPSTILPAMKKGIRVRVLNTFAPDETGTTITDHSVSSDKGIKSIAYKENQVLINIESTQMFMAHGFLGKIANVFAECQVILDMISTSETTVSLTAAPGKNLEPALKEIEGFAEIEVDYGKSILCVVGEGIPQVGNVASRMLSVLEKENITLEMISQAKIGINISVLINDEDIDKAVNALHNEFFSK